MKKEEAVIHKIWQQFKESGNVIQAEQDAVNKVFTISACTGTSHTTILRMGWFFLQVGRSECLLSSKPLQPVRTESC